MLCHVAVCPRLTVLLICFRYAGPVPGYADSSYSLVIVEVFHGCQTLA